MVAALAMAVAVAIQVNLFITLLFKDLIAFV